MNDRFQELHNQARDFYLQDEYLDVSTKELHRLVEQKFAELLIRECMREIRHKSFELLDIDFYPHYLERLKKHFGVTE